MEQNLLKLFTRDAICRWCFLLTVIGLGIGYWGMQEPQDFKMALPEHLNAPPVAAAPAAEVAPPTLEAPAAPGAKWLPTPPKSAAKPLVAAEGELVPDLPLPEHPEDVLMMMHPRTKQFGQWTNFAADFGVFHLGRR